MDASLNNTSFYHSFIVVKSRLWNVTDSGIMEVNSARILINALEEFPYHYVDIVSEKALEGYIRKLRVHFEKYSHQHIKKQWKWIDRLNWTPGNDISNLKKSIGFGDNEII
ncbi:MULTISPECIES: hypothetical protein [unclassified Acidiphilium]|uniref:hypothetical protein n=1 Tax=unclassified Acidiphilium TaxID=2617493 RepID=UPI00257F9BF3|nr:MULTISPECIES: hypothetical protein [unclassified Acidiphilium]HQT82513.1 hypothetical protein [Ferrovaceae bacterium]